MLVSANLKRKRIFLETENFDIISVLRQAALTQDSKSHGSIFKEKLTIEE